MSETLLARINYQISVYDAGGGNRTIQVREECFPAKYNFVKGDKNEGFKLISEIADIIGIKVKLDER